MLVSLDNPGLPDPDAVRVALAVSLFSNGAVSAGFAARMAGKLLPDLLALLSSLGIPLAGGAADGHDDMNTARQWLDQTSSSPTPRPLIAPVPHRRAGPPARRVGGVGHAGSAPKYL